jgi:hypothetical protein
MIMVKVFGRNQQKSSLPEDWGLNYCIAHYGGFNFDLKNRRKIWKKEMQRKSDLRLFYMLQKMK